MTFFLISEILGEFIDCMNQAQSRHGWRQSESTCAKMPALTLEAVVYRPINWPKIRMTRMILSRAHTSAQAADVAKSLL